MVSAELKYRNQPTGDLFAQEFSRIKFQGDEDLVRALNTIVMILQYEKSLAVDLKIQNLNVHNINCYKEMKMWRQQIREFRLRHLGWMFNKDLRDEMKILQAEYENINSRIDNYEYIISQLGMDKYYTATELTEKFKYLLAELGFKCKASSQSDNNSHSETYDSTCTDEELLKRVESMTTALEEQREKKFAQINETYQNPDIINCGAVFSLD